MQETLLSALCDSVRIRRADKWQREKLEWHRQVFERHSWRYLSHR